MSHHPPCLFSNSPLDRLNNVRHSQNLLSSVLPDKSLYLVFSSTLHVLFTHNLSLALLSPDTLPSYTNPQLFLGVSVSDHVAYYAVRLAPSFDVSQYLKHNLQFQFLSVRSVITNNTNVSTPHAAIVAHARSLFEFHQRHQYCGACGSQTVSDHAGSRRRCVRNINSEEPHILKSDQTTCNGVWFPRSDPVVIMLVRHPSHDSVLLARSARHHSNFYSCLAGFMEHGESLEDAVRREVIEEVGIRIGPVRYFNSQPWPFPYSLMLGCVALAEDSSITLDDKELEHATWFGRDQVADMLKPSHAENTTSHLVVPPTTTIAGMMCDTYVRGDPITSFPSYVSPSPASSSMH